MNVMYEEKINLQQLLSKNHVFISSKEAMSDVVPIQWESDVVSGARKIMLSSHHDSAEE